jgi:hypothetical protein
VNTCQPDFAACGAQAVTEVRAMSNGQATRWRPVCQAHALRFEQLVTARGYGFEHRPVQLLRDVLNHQGDPKVVPITRAERAA